MPMNAPQEYYELEERYSKEKDIEEKEKILKRMMVILPKHKGTDREFGSLKRRLSLLKKEASRKPLIHKTTAIRKRWPRVSLVGYSNETILKLFNLTRIDNLLYGIVKINNVQVQMISIKDPEKNKDLLLQSEIIISKEKIDRYCKFQVISDNIDVEKALEDFGVIGVYTENSRDAVAMERGETVKDLVKKLHLKIEKNTYAVIFGKSAKFQGQRVALSHRLEDGDRIFIKT
jgi:ribosome-interacting GTPase 1